jgi:hypothetical protein
MFHTDHLKYQDMTYLKILEMLVQFMKMLQLLIDIRDVIISIGHHRQLYEDLARGLCKALVVIAMSISMILLEFFEFMLMCYNVFDQE